MSPTKEVVYDECRLDDKHVVTCRLCGRLVRHRDRGGAPGELYHKRRLTHVCKNCFRE